MKEYTNKLIAAVESGEVDWESVARSALELLHDDTVAEMAYDEGYLWDE
jgi:hypothetical protein